MILPPDSATWRVCAHWHRLPRNSRQKAASRPPTSKTHIKTFGALCFLVKELTSKVIGLRKERIANRELHSILGSVQQDRSRRHQSKPLVDSGAGCLPVGLAASDLSGASGCFCHSHLPIEWKSLPRLTRKLRTGEIGYVQRSYLHPTLSSSV
jgi:hypothetical protein